MADTYEQNLGQKTTLTVSDYIRVVGSDNASYKQLVSDVAKKIIENYTGSSLAGSSQSVKSALDALNSKLSDASIAIDTGNKTTFTFSNLHNLNNSSMFKHGLLVWGVSSNSQSAGISFVFVDTSGNVTIFNLTGNTDRTFTGSVSGTTLTITTSQTMYGGLKLIWLT